MKPQTIANDIRATLLARSTTKLATASRNRVNAVLNHGDLETITKYVQQHLKARQAEKDADLALRRLPKARKEGARKYIEVGQDRAHAATLLGANYSGATDRSVSWRDDDGNAVAYTLTDKGEQYSRRVTFKKTDACHYVNLAPDGIPGLINYEFIANASDGEGLPLISLYAPDRKHPGVYRANWVRAVRKQIEDVQGWIAGNAGCIFHSTVSPEHALKGFRAKNERHLAELRHRRLNQAGERRAALVARLCHGAVATIEDARAKGYCSPGIEAFQSRHGIGNTATLPELVRTGEPAAIALAMQIARNVGKATA